MMNKEKRIRISYEENQNKNDNWTSESKTDIHDICRIHTHIGVIYDKKEKFVANIYITGNYLKQNTEIKNGGNE